MNSLDSRIRLDTRPEVVQAQPQSRLQIDLRFPTKKTLRFADIRLALKRIVLWKWAINNLALRARYAQHSFGTFKDSPFVRIPDVDRQMLVTPRKPKNPFNLVGNVAETRVWSPSP